jgi:uncharacterized protein (TIGR02246 family)
MTLRLVSTLALCAACATSRPPSQKEDPVAETTVRQRVEELARALSAKDIDRAMSVYAPDIVSFDINPPLRYAGADRKRQAWLEAFRVYSGGFSYEVRELDVAAQGDLAFVHSLNHVTGTLGNGHATNMWVRWTACFRRIDGAWLIVHDHVSVPADLAHAGAVTDLAP